MSRRDDEMEKDGPVSPGEQARAEAFGRLVDGLLAGDALPPAMDSEDRALVEAATVVMASSRAIEPAPERTRRLVDQALEAAILRRSGGGAVTTAERERAPAASVVARAAAEDDRAERSATDLTTRRRRRTDQVARVLPWAVASLAAAAAIVLFVVRPPHKDGAGAETAEVAPFERTDQELPLDVIHTSRPADPLVGPLAEADRGKATQRIDLIFADRMAGYRDLTFRRALPAEVDR